MRFKEFLKSVDEGAPIAPTGTTAPSTTAQAAPPPPQRPGAAPAQQAQAPQRPGAAPAPQQKPGMKAAKPMTGRDLVKKLSTSDLTDQDRASVERAVAGQMNRPLNSNDVNRIQQRTRIDLSSLLDEEEHPKIKDFHQWMQACKDAHPDFAAQMRFKVDGDAHVAYVRGIDRIFGIWEGDDDGEGMVLESKMAEAGEDLVWDAVAKTPRGNMHKGDYILALVDVVKSLDKHNLFKGDVKAIEAMIRTVLDL